MTKPVLEPAAQEFADASSKPPFLSDLGPEGARGVLGNMQAELSMKPDVEEMWVTVAADVGDVRVRLTRPVGADNDLPVILYLHGGGWVLGSSATHDRLVRELTVGAGAAVAFVEYARSPEARYPIAIEQAYAAARWMMVHGPACGLDVSRMVVAGDSAGGNMAAALVIMAKQRGDVLFIHQSLYYPVTDAEQNTNTYREFADGPSLTAKSMAWFWDAYAPDESRRAEITASPLRATLDDLSGLPPALVVVAENDVLRDEGEAYARRLTSAGVPTTSVRYNGTVHDFMMLNPLRYTHATTAAIGQAISTFRSVLRSD